MYRTPADNPIFVPSFGFYASSADFQESEGGLTTTEVALIEELPGMDEMDVIRLCNNLRRVLDTLYDEYGTFMHPLVAVASRLHGRVEERAYVLMVGDVNEYYGLAEQDLAQDEYYPDEDEVGEDPYLYFDDKGDEVDPTAGIGSLSALLRVHWHDIEHLGEEEAIRLARLRKEKDAELLSVSYFSSNGEEDDIDDIPF